MMPRRFDFLFPPPPPSLETLGGVVAETSVDTHKNGGSSSNNLNPSLLIIGLILIAVFFASVSLHLLFRYLNRSCSSSSADNDVASTEPHHFNRLYSRRVSPEDQTLIDSLPLFSFNSVTRLRRSSVADCAVCLSRFEPHDQLRLLPLCCHAFHARCIDTWLASSHTCPLCRSSIHVAESECLMKPSSSSAGGDSFRIAIGSVSRRILASDSDNTRRSYSVGSFEYVVEEESEVVLGPAHMRGASECSRLSRKENDDVASPVNMPTTEPPGSHVAAEVAGGRAWLKDYVDRLASSASSSFSSRTMSFRFSGRIFTRNSFRSDGFSGSSRRSDGGAAAVGRGGSWDLEGNRIGEEFSNFFRWLSGV